MRNTTPGISVMLCAYNAAQYIGEAIQSVLQQTYNDFELIVVDDGSTDDTLSIIESFRDERIRIIRGQHNYIHSLNLGLRKCRGKYIARMDADDKMMPERLEKQFAIMEKHPDISVCFSWAMAFGSQVGRVGYNAKEWVDNAFFWLLTGNFLIHPTAMIRKSFLQEHKLHYKNYPYAEDYKLWVDVSRIGGIFYVIPTPLLMYRISNTQVSEMYHEEQHATTLLIKQEIVEELLNRMMHPQTKTIKKIYKQALLLNNAGLMYGDEIATLMYHLITRTEYFNKGNLC
ncbi:MAG: glycosyltransferase [Bacteroidaceae bacterium]|nr:glycosyltransferase [Bacteroidaceae bacterium]